MFLIHAAVLAAVVACNPAGIFAALYHASGGSAWHRVAELRAEGTIVDGGVRGSFRTARDLATGRSSYSESLPLGYVAFVYDGSTLWQQNEDRGVSGMSAPDSLARAKTTAYLNRNGLWGGHGAAFECVGNRISVWPRGGSVADVYVNQRSHLIDRIVQQLPEGPLTTQFSGYRMTAGLNLPHIITKRYTDQYGNPAITIESVRSYQILRLVAASDFAKPEDPPPGQISGGAASATIPFNLEKGVVVFKASVNGKGPFPFVFDAGAQGVLTSVVGQSRVHELEIGSARIHDLPISFYAGKPSDLFPKRDANEDPLGGVLGPEILDRFAVRIDYRSSTMTLTPRSSFVYSGTGVALPFTLQEGDDVPLIAATVNGKSGVYEYDVRSPSSIVMFRQPSATAGTATLSLAGATLQDVPVRSMTALSGKFGSTTEAGLLGSAVLSQFVTTIDYAAQRIYFEPVPPK